MNETAAIAAFWTAWPTIQAGLVKAIDTGDVNAYGDLPKQISRLVEAIHEDLQWELGPGERAEHCFMMSAVGDPELRVLAERWLASAPKDDPVFEHVAARRARPGVSIAIQGHHVEPAEMLVRARTDDTRERIDVEVWHAAFTSMPEDLRGTVTFLMLDGALGEDDVERWIGAVEPISNKPWGGIPLPKLVDEVDALRARATGDRWVVLKGEREGRPIFASVNRALKRIDHLLCSYRVELAIALRDVDDQGLPSKDELAAIAEGEDRLLESLQDAVFAGTTTHAGHRTLVFYAMESSPMLARLETFAREAGWSAEVRIERDPTWQWSHDFG